jgi:hypothetical protein
VAIGALPELARRYRSRLDGDAGDAVASAQLARLTLVAETVLRAQLREPEDRSARVGLYVKYVGVGILFGACAWVAVRILARQG